MDEFIVDVNRRLTFQDGVRWRFRPDNPFIRTIEFGIRPKDMTYEEDFIAYVACRIWNTASQRENAFWRYALEYEKENEEKPFATICNYLNKSAASIIKRKKPISGWITYISEFTVYEDVLGKLGMERKQLEPKILMAIADILQYSFLIKPEYGFICADETLPESLQFAEFKKFGQVGQTTVFIKNFK